MELVIFFIVVTVISIGSFWITGLVYGLFHKPAIYFPMSLAAKMAFCAVFGSLLFMVGGVVLSTLVFNVEMAKRPDYNKWSTIISGVVISVLCIVAIYFSTIALAWQILD